ncbi:hypothetical protein [Azorhizobium caulinodans]|nr:hypothetical protein [Azorhizobium caulinodans]
MNLVRVPEASDTLDISDLDVDAAIEACHGDMRGTIRALLIAYVMLEQDMQANCSRGYARRPPHASGSMAGRQ